jgi:hypothetical protein
MITAADIKEGVKVRLIKDKYSLGENDTLVLKQIEGSGLGVAGCYAYGQYECCSFTIGRSGLTFNLCLAGIFAKKFVPFKNLELITEQP